VNGRQVYDGEVVVVGDTGGDAEVVYELLCRRHWLRGETGRAADDAAELVDGTTLTD
jgi:thymidine kinase